MNKKRHFYPETWGQLFADILKFSGIGFGIYAALSIVPASIYMIGLNNQYNEDEELYQTEMDFQKNLAESISKQANIDFLVLQIKEVSFASDESDNYLMLKGKGVIDVEKGVSDFSIVLNVSDYYKPILEKDIKYLNRFSQIEEYEKYLDQTFPEDSLSFIYKQDLVNTLHDLMKAPTTNLISIYNNSTLEEVYTSNNPDDNWDR